MKSVRCFVYSLDLAHLSLPDKLAEASRLWRQVKGTEKEQEYVEKAKMCSVEKVKVEDLSIAEVKKFITTKQKKMVHLVCSFYCAVLI
jgi:hypothetical protein